MRISISYFFIIWSLSLGANAQQFRVLTYTTQEDGLPTNQINTTIIDSTGYLWLGTDAGVVRFDGNNFRLYEKNLPSGYIKDFCYQKNGRLIFSTDAGVYEIEGLKNRVDLKPLILADLQPTDTTLYYPNQLFEDIHENLWISEPNASLVRYREGKLKRFKFDAQNATCQSNSCFNFLEDPMGNLWVAAQTGYLYRFDYQKDQFLKMSNPDQTGPIIALSYAGSRELLLFGNWVFKASFNENNFITEVRKVLTVPFQIISVAHAPNQKLYFGTDQGLYRVGDLVNFKDLEKVFSHNDPHRVEELPFTKIHHLLFASDGDVWISSDSGLGLLQTNFFSSVGSLPMQHIYSISQSATGKIYISFGELFSLTQEKNIMTATQILGTKNGLILAAVSKGKKVWASNVESELLFLESGKIKKKLSFAKRGGAIFYMLLDLNDNLWICQAPSEKPIIGVVKLTPDTKMQYYQQDKGLENRILVIKQSPFGILFAAGIGNDTYLYRYLEKTDSFINISLPLPFSNPRFEVHDLAIDSTGIIWLGTTDGLLRYNSERIERIDLGDYTNSEVRSVAIAKDGSIWAATDTYGLLRYQDKEVVIFDESSGLPSKITTYRTLMIDQDQRIWVGTAEGLAPTQAVNPQPQNTPVPIFLKITANGEEMVETESNEFPNHSLLEFTYASLSYPGEGIQYQYRVGMLSQLSSPWTDLGSKTQTVIPQLTFGEYYFQIRAKQTGGFRWSEPVDYHFVIKQIWYQTWWSYTIFGAAAVLLILSLIKLSTYKLRREKVRLEELVKEKGSTSPFPSTPGKFDNLESLQNLINDLTRSQDWNQRMVQLFKDLIKGYQIDCFGIGTFDSKTDHIEVQEFIQNNGNIGKKLYLSPT